MSGSFCNRCNSNSGDVDVEYIHGIVVYNIVDDHDYFQQLFYDFNALNTIYTIKSWGTVCGTYRFSCIGRKTGSVTEDIDQKDNVEKDLLLPARGLVLDETKPDRIDIGHVDLKDFIRLDFWKQHIEW